MAGLPFPRRCSGNLLFLSGQLRRDNSGRVVPGGIAAETQQTMENIKAALAARIVARPRRQGDRLPGRHGRVGGDEPSSPASRAPAENAALSANGLALGARRNRCIAVVG